MLCIVNRKAISLKNLFLTSVFESFCIYLVFNFYNWSLVGVQSVSLFVSIYIRARRRRRRRPELK